MEQQQETRHRPLNIHLKKDGELNLSGLTLENLSTEEFLVVQQLIDESKVRSHNANRVEELMQRGLMAQGVIAAFAILMFSFIGIYGIYRYVGQQVQQIQETYSNVR
jgi:amino acid transporter